MHICRQGLRGDKRNHTQVILCRNHTWNTYAESNQCVPFIFTHYLSIDSSPDKPPLYLAVDLYDIFSYIYIYIYMSYHTMH